MLFFCCLLPIATTVNRTKSAFIRSGLGVYPVPCQGSTALDNFIMRA